MAKTKKKVSKKKAAKKKEAAKIINTIEDGQPIEPTGALQKLLPYAIEALKKPVQTHVSDVMQGLVSSVLLGEEFDTDELKRRLFDIRLGNQPLHEIVEKIEDIKALLKKL